MSKVTVPAEEVTDFTLNMSFDDGVGVEIVVKYPKGEALAAVQALSQVGTSTYILGLMDALRDDPKISEKLEELGIVFDDEEDY